MKNSLLILSVAISATLYAPYALAGTKEATDSDSSNAVTPKKNGTSMRKDKGKIKSPQVDKSSKSESKAKASKDLQKKDTPFIDRDGDGIQDGQEHRFRRRHRHRRHSNDSRHQRNQDRTRAKGSPGAGKK